METEEENVSEEGSVSISTEAFSTLKTMCHFMMQTENTHEALEAIDKLDDFWKMCAEDKNNQMKITNYFRV